MLVDIFEMMPDNPRPKNDFLMIGKMFHLWSFKPEGKELTNGHIYQTR